MKNRKEIRKEFYVAGTIFVTITFILLAFIIAALSSVFTGCSDEIIQQESQSEFIIIKRVDSTCPMKMRCVFYDTLYYGYDTINYTGL